MLKKWTKRTKIIVASTMVVVLCVGLGLGLYFGLRQRERTYTLHAVRINGLNISVNNADSLGSDVERLIRHVWRPASGQQLAPQLVGLEVDGFPLGAVVVPMIDTILGNTNFTGTPAVRVRALIDVVMPIALENPSLILRLAELDEVIFEALLTFLVYEGVIDALYAYGIADIEELLTFLEEDLETDFETEWAKVVEDFTGQATLMTQLFDFLIAEVTLLIRGEGQPADWDTEDTFDLFNAIIDIDVEAVLDVLAPVMGGLNIMDLVDSALAIARSLSLVTNGNQFSIGGLGTAIANALEIMEDVIGLDLSEFEVDGFETVGDFLDFIVDLILEELDLRFKVNNGIVEILVGDTPALEYETIAGFAQLLPFALDEFLDEIGLQLRYASRTFTLASTINVQSIAQFFGDDTVPIDFDITIEIDFRR